MVNRRRLLRLTQDLIRINSENPPGDERRIAAFVARYLRDIGLRPKIRTFYPRRDNVAAVLSGGRLSKRWRKGQKKGRSSPLLITPHLDTVPAGKGWASDPFSARLRKDKIFGRGATDCKGNLAVALEVLRSLVEEEVSLKNDVVFLATADEETGSTKGLIPFLEKGIVRPAFALVLDSDDFNIITAQKGLIHFKVKVTGRKAHGAYPDRGTSAIDGALALIEALKGIKWPHRRHRLLKAPTVNIGTIRGGDKVNMVADWCEFEVDLRFLPGMNAEKLLSRTRRVFNQRRIFDCSKGKGRIKKCVKYQIEVNAIQQPYEIARAHPLVRSLKEAASEVGRRSNIKGSEGATVITFFRKKGIPAVATGYGSCGCAHATDEYVRIGDLYQGACLLEHFIKIFDKKR